MTPTVWKRVVSPLVGSDWAFSKLLAYMRPVGWVLYGMLADRSASGGFYVWVVRMPLYQPSSVLDLSWSERMGGGSSVWDLGPATDRALAATAKSVAEAYYASESVLVPPPGGADNVRMQEVRAYGLVLEGDLSAAAEVLGRVGRYAARQPWEQDLVDRARMHRDLLLAGRAEQVHSELARWRRDTAEAIGVPLW